MHAHPPQEASPPVRAGSSHICCKLTTPVLRHVTFRADNIPAKVLGKLLKTLTPKAPLQKDFDISEMVGGRPISSQGGVVRKINFSKQHQID